MDPSGVERVVAAGDLEEPGSLDERGVSKPGNLLKLLAILERSMFQTIFVQSSCRQLIQAGHGAEQCWAGGINVHADIIDAGFDNGVERIAKMSRFDVMLIHANADIGRVDLDQFGERVKQSSCDGDSAPLHRIVFGQLLPADRAG